MNPESFEQRMDADEPMNADKKSAALSRPHPRPSASIRGSSLRDLLRAFRRETGFTAVETDVEGRSAGGRGAKHRDPWRAHVIREALRWGEACVMPDGDGLVGWGLPLMTNALVTGGVIVEGVPLEGGEPGEI